MAENVQLIARDVINVTRETILQWFVEENDTGRKAYIHHTILCLKPACSSLREQNKNQEVKKDLITKLHPNTCMWEILK